ncbi:MAG: MBL fold metallo-hydrolase [Clostridia bacterium]|nr:MBL fold metallo-hydrolase [Clostridia bacterium]
MKLQYLGHASVRLISEIGTTIICDPYDEGLVGYPMPRLTCDLATISHGHADHNCVEALGNIPAVLDCAGNAVLDDVSITAFQTWHDDKQGALRGGNLVFTFGIDALRVAHLGDLGEVSTQIADKLQGTNVLIIPIGGNYTIDAKQAKWYVDQIAPQIVVPIHYSQGGTIDIAPVEEFTMLFDKSHIVYATDFYNIDDIDENTTKIVVISRIED